MHIQTLFSNPGDLLQRTEEYVTAAAGEPGKFSRKQLGRPRDAAVRA